MVNYHKKIYLLYLIIFLFYLNFTDCIKKRLEEQEVISYILKDYDTRVRPRGTNNSWPGLLI